MSSSIGLQCLSERLTDSIDVVDNCLNVAIGGVFAFDDLNVSLTTIDEVFNEFALCVKGVSNRPDEVRLVMFGFMS